MEPLFDTGSRSLKNEITAIIVSDAGAPLERIPPGWALSPFRVKRIADIALDQTRALRIRVLIKFLQSDPANGMYLQLGAHAHDRIERYGAVNPERSAALLAQSWLDADQVDLAAAEPTSLGRLTPETFDRLEQHGYETARWNELLYQRQHRTDSILE